MNKICVLIVCLMLAQAIRADGVFSQKEFTVRVEPGAIECFYERAQKSQIIDFEYQGIWLLLWRFSTKYTFLNLKKNTFNRMFVCFVFAVLFNGI